jgi:cytochrome c
MRTPLICALAVAGVLSAGVAQASLELSKSAGCVKCHELDKKKKGPSFKDTAAKFKGKPDAEATLLKMVTDPKGDHPEIPASPEDIKTMIKWILTQ